MPKVNLGKRVNHPSPELILLDEREKAYTKLFTDTYGNSMAIMDVAEELRRSRDFATKVMRGVPHKAGTKMYHTPDVAKRFVQRECEEAIKQLEQEERKWKKK